jgi:hypothetical protein
MHSLTLLELCLAITDRNQVVDHLGEEAVLGWILPPGPCLHPILTNLHRDKLNCPATLKP